MWRILHELGGGLIGVGSLFCWIPMVWLIVKWKERAEEKRQHAQDENEEQLRKLVREEPWKLSPEYWQQAIPTGISDAPEAPGDFYVAPGECVSCGAPAAVAPNLIRHSSEPYHSCYFIKQPSTDEELRQAVAAVNASCVCAVRYRGNDPQILSQISPMSVDHPFKRGEDRLQ